MRTRLALALAVALLGGEARADVTVTGDASDLEVEAAGDDAGEAQRRRLALRHRLGLRLGFRLGDDRRLARRRGAAGGEQRPLARRRQVVEPEPRERREDRRAGAAAGGVARRRDIVAGRVDEDVVLGVRRRQRRQAEHRHGEGRGEAPAPRGRRVCNAPRRSLRIRRSSPADRRRPPHVPLPAAAGAGAPAAGRQ